MREFSVIAEVLDASFSLLGKYGKWLNVKKNRLCFIVWSVSLTFWIFRDLYLGLYSQAFFCLVSLVFNFYGFYNWGKEGKKKEKSES
jgi:nicotinamide riboside transporter PnuC